MVVLVVGASGELGGRVAARLLEQGVDVRAGTRDPARVAALADAGAKPVPCDLRDPQQVADAVAGVDVVLHAAHGLAPERGNGIEQVDREGVARLVDAAQRAGVRHLVLCSIAGAHADHALAFFRAKAEAEHRVRRSAMTHTIVRMSAFLDGQAVALHAPALRRGRPTVVVGDGHAPRSWVAVDDAADLVLEAITASDGRHDDRTLVVVGPEVSTEQVVDRIATTLGVRPRVVRVPAAVVAAARRVAGGLHLPATELLDVVLHVARHGDPLHPTPDATVLHGSRDVADVTRRWLALQP